MTPLILGNSLSNSCPYRYPYQHKNGIEKIVKELLDAGFIQSSVSPFFALILLVKKEGWILAIMHGFL